MTVASGTITNVSILKGYHDETPLQVALVLFTLSGTYAQADNAQLLAVDAAITANVRNGQAVTLVDAMLYQPAADAGNATTGGLLLCAKTIAVSGSNITFEVTESATAGVIDVSTEFADATALPAQGWPFGFLVSFYETTAL